MDQKTSRNSWTDILLPSALILGLVFVLSSAAALVIGVAILRAIGLYLYQLVIHTDPHFDYLEWIRLRLGRVLALGLEFTIASDILRTVVSPTRQEIMNLGAIVLLRSLLNYFLEMEISMAEGRSPLMPEAVPVQLRRGDKQ
jgi:uncharacterized membrane protein